MFCSGVPTGVCKKQRLYCPLCYVKENSTYLSLTKRNNAGSQGPKVVRTRSQGKNWTSNSLSKSSGKEVPHWKPSSNSPPGRPRRKPAKLVPLLPRQASSSPTATLPSIANWQSSLLMTKIIPSDHPWKGRKSTTMSNGFDASPRTSKMAKTLRKCGRNHIKEGGHQN